MVIHLALYYGPVKYDTLMDTRSEHFQLSGCMAVFGMNNNKNFILISS